MEAKGRGRWEEHQRLRERESGVERGHDGPREQTEDPASMDRENEWKRTNRSPRGSQGYVPGAIQTLAPTSSIKLVEDPMTISARNGPYYIYGMRGGLSQEDAGDSFLWRETLGRSLRTRNAVEPVGETCHGNGCRKQTTRYTQMGWSPATHNRVLHHALVR